MCDDDLILVRLSFMETLLSALLVLFPGIVQSFSYDSCGPNAYRCDKAFHRLHTQNFYRLLRFLYWNIFIVSFYITFLYEDITTSINKHI
jgi:hypothetical protein